MAVTLTEAAAQRVKTMLDKRGHGIGLKVSTKVSGCTGFAYVVDYADEITEGDNVYESFGVQVVVPKKVWNKLTEWSWITSRKVS